MISLPVAITSLIIITAVALYARSRQRYRLPPGPWGWPILGNFFDMPNEFEWRYWAKFKDAYGDVSSVTVLGKSIVIFNTLQACIDVLEKSSSISAGRPRMPFAGEMVGWDQQLLLVPYNKHFRAMRKLAHGLIGTKAAAYAYAEVQEAESRYLILRIHQQPDDLIKNLRVAIGAILLRMSHGYITRTDGTDPFINLIELASKDFYQATKPGKWFVDIFPWMKYIPNWIPGTGFKQTAERYRKINIDQTDMPYKFALRSLEKKEALPSFVSSALQSGKLTDDERYALKFCAAAMYGGGLDTMTGATSTFFLLMILHPEIQRKAQEELNQVVGSNRLPVISDRTDLPYLSAIQKEVYRWGSIVPLGIPHCATEDIIYGKYCIPKGTLLVNNIWKIAHDPDLYHDPMSFKPERFMGEKAELDPETFIFGFGRRKCPGIEVAHSTVFIIMAACLSVYQFGHPKDRNGVETPLGEEFLSGSVIHPKPFRCSIEPRSPDALNLLHSLQAELQGADRVPSKI